MSPRNHRSRPHWRWWAALAAVAPLGCSGELTGIAGSTTSVVAGSGSSTPVAGQLDPALLGRWRRVVVFAAGDGSTNSSETIWSFAADGAALRTVVSRNLTFGYADGASAAAYWRTEGGTVVITFHPPDRGTVRFAYAVALGGYSDLLYLNGQSFARVGP